MTGIANRRSFDERLASEWERTKRQKAPFAVMMVDIDAFKRFNDTYGHQCGDDCLRKVALSLEQTAKQYGGTAARYGGEEFAVILPHTSPSEAAAAAEAVRANVERSPFRTIPPLLLVLLRSASEPPSPSHSQMKARSPFFPLPIRRFIGPSKTGATGRK
ncbi:diguanylate cyclase [Geobacillus sp. WSUCF1]|uniref:diguanylate cyclase n=1 Tax=Geobacillus sp. WSUCF1 TaxID=886559 RepID=UPI0003589876|nr:diguanylate cyclase [Geobacillus sp. WSUCF1]EPR29325.1 hypothetical protein I656_01037 [Geobacillus sp. WSUCF1]